MSAQMHPMLPDEECIAAATCAAQLARMWDCDVTEVFITTTPEAGGTFAAVARGPNGRAVAARRLPTRARAIAGITPAYHAACTLTRLSLGDALITIERALAAHSAGAPTEAQRAAVYNLALRASQLAEKVAEDDTRGPDPRAS